mmetsp:Transcript_24136/g.42715  ORF Transcript_24136/g.42715 Transcript_24136/m.42715 type:complete len:260 (+) Transcript_24136:89-868(+)
MYVYICATTSYFAALRHRYYVILAVGRATKGGRALASSVDSTLSADADVALDSLLVPILDLVSCANLRQSGAILTGGLVISCSCTMEMYATNSSIRTPPPLLPQLMFKKSESYSISSARYRGTGLPLSSKVRMIPSTVMSGVILLSFSLSFGALASSPLELLANARKSFSTLSISSSPLAIAAHIDRNSSKSIESTWFLQRLVVFFPLLLPHLEMSLEISDSSSSWPSRFISPASSLAESTAFSLAKSSKTSLRALTSP